MNQDLVTLVCTFRVGSLVCGVPLRHVQEITGELPMTPMPLAPEVVIGLIDLRGQVVTVLDSRRRLGLPVRPEPSFSCHLVIRRGDGVISLLVEEVCDVVETTNSAIMPPPQTLGAHARQFVSGVLESEDALVLMLDIDAVTALESRS